MTEAAILYFRHLGWLASTPEKTNKTRFEMHKGSAFEKYEPEPICKLLVEIVLECGIKSSNGFGVNAISWAEINSWSQAMGDTNYWLNGVIRLMSECYIHELNEGKNPSRPSPIANEIDTNEKRKSVSKQFKNFISSRG